MSAGRCFCRVLEHGLVLEHWPAPLVPALRKMTSICRSPPSPLRTTRHSLLSTKLLMKTTGDERQAPLSTRDTREDRSRSCPPVQDEPVSKPPKLTRAERRERRASAPDAGVYGVDALDAGADAWTGRYLVWAGNPDEAKERVRAAGFYKRQLERHWTPSNPPPGGVPDKLGRGVVAWYRRRLNDGGVVAMGGPSGDLPSPSAEPCRD